MAAEKKKEGQRLEKEAGFFWKRSSVAEQKEEAFSSNRRCETGSRVRGGEC
jgi:hypothetical protein